MTTFKRFAHSLALTIIPLAFAVAQTPQVSTVNVTPDGQKVRVSALGDVFDLRVSVSDESGDIVFEGGPVSGQALDWALADPQGQRVPAGAYTLSVTYRTAAGKLKRRVEQVLVTDEAAGDDGQAKTEAQAAPAPEPLAPTGSGTAGKIAKWTTSANLGNSVMTESAARIGINTAAPAHTLTINGGPAWTTSGFVGSVALSNNGAIGWASNSAGQRQGLGHNNNGLYFFRTSSNPGAATSAALADLVISNAGNVGVGTAAPASKLTINGGIQILGAGNGIRFADGSIQTKATAGTINGTGTANRLAKFTGPNSFGNSSITEVSGNVGIGTGATPPQARLDVRGNVAVQNGNVGIGTASPLRALQIGESPDAAFTIEPSPGSPVAGYISFGDGTGWQLRIARQRESSGGPLITRSPQSAAGLIVTIDDQGQVRQHIGQFTTRFFSGGVFSVCRTEHGGDGVSGTLAACSSSLRHKTAVQPFAAGLELVGRLRPISFTWKEGGTRDLGLAAEDVAQVEPLLVTYDDKGQVDGVKYDRLGSVFINAFKEQQEQIREQQKLIERQGKQLEQVQARLAQVERSVKKRRAARR
jgi:hypothetical protein